ncbi:MAG: Ig domain-containing protein [Clostridia bacterium]|nr:Ig domain-containing protein [Clostridia bacterium]
MKKTILLILLVLPIVLIVVVSIAGWVATQATHHPVRNVSFLDRYNNPYTENDTFIVEQGKTKATKIEIEPDFATNKSVTYTSSDESICTIDANGVVTGVHYGSATITVTTNSEDKTHTINVKVIANIPFAVDLNKTELKMYPNSMFQLEAVVDAPVAINKKVHFSSDAPDIVYVDKDTGKLFAKAPGKANVTVTTESGNLTKTCEIEVLSSNPPILLDFAGKDGVNFIISDSGVFCEFSSETVNIKDYIIVDSSINPDDVAISLEPGTEALATISDGTITFTSRNTLIPLYIKDKNNSDYFYEIKVILP